MSDNNTGCVRLYGEVFGGKYGGSSDHGAIKTQSEPNYCPQMTLPSLTHM